MIEQYYHQSVLYVAKKSRFKNKSENKKEQ